MLWRQGQPQRIRLKAVEVLLLLIDQRPQTLSHEQIAVAIWGKRDLAAKQITRAVMEARRGIGDDPESPTCILSVRGVGYRFGAEVTVADGDSTLQTDCADAGVSEARADIDAAAACLRCGDYEQARRLADRAISAADLAGARPELVRALTLAASALLRMGSSEHALTLATKAMRLAQSVGSDGVLAHGQLGLAEVQLWTGSAHAALDHLQAAHRVLAPAGITLPLWHCERLFIDTYRQIGWPEVAWQWCERAEASARQLEPETRAVHERLLKVAILHGWIEMADADGRDEDLRNHGLKALELLDAIEPDAQAIGCNRLELSTQTYRASTLEAMGRVEEALTAIDKLRAVLFGAQLDPSPLLEMRRNAFRQIEAGLLSRSGRAVEAIAAIEACVAMAPNFPEPSMELASVQEQAARICERAGRHKEAMAWRRRQLQTNTRLHADKAQATAGIVRAQLESDRLGEDLAQAGAEIAQLQQLNHELEGRILQMDRHTLVDDGGLVSAAALAATVDARAALARERELPLCIGMVEMFVPPDEAGVEADFVMRRRLKLLSSMLKTLIPEASAAAQWRVGLCFFIIADLGLGPARLRCQALAQRLNAEAVPTTHAELVVNFRGDAVDVTRFTGIEAAMGHLPSLAGAAPLMA